MIYNTLNNLHYGVYIYIYYGILITLTYNYNFITAAEWN